MTSSRSEASAEREPQRPLVYTRAMKQSVAELSTVLERAQASQNMALAKAVAAFSPESGATAKEFAGGIGIFLGEGHPLNQGLALGLGHSLDEATLIEMEVFLGRGGHPVVVELTAGAEPELGLLLAKRGFHVRQFQNVWIREIDGAGRGLEQPALEGFEVRQARRDEAMQFARLLMAGFTEQDELPTEDGPLVWPPVLAEGTTAWMAWHKGAPVAGGTLGISGQVATLSGTTVLPAFRGRGLQRVLIGARLTAARELGAKIAVSATLPMSASAENVRRTGFRVVYPKIEMANG
jgi:GNAT superfamily N-acetyltransferase